MKKILFVEGASYISYPRDPEKNVGGSSVSLCQLIKGLNRERYLPSALFYYDSPVIEQLVGLDVEVLTRIRSPRFMRKKKAISSLFKPETYSKLSFNKLFFRYIVPDSLRLFRGLAAVKPDLVHCNVTLGDQLSPLLAARLARIPAICHVRSFESLFLIPRACSRFVRFFICISDAVRKNYLAQGIRPERLLVIPNGVDVEQWRPWPSDAGAADRFTILQAGRMIGWKGHRVLLRAIPRVLSEFPRARFVLAGDGPLRKELENLAVQKGLGDAIEFRGTVSEMDRVIAESDIVVNPSTEPEPFGRVIIEAMAMGKPVIATAIGGPLEIITPGLNGELVEPDQPGILAEKILFLLKDEEARKRMGQAARRTVLERFDHRFTVRKIEEVYEEVLGGS